MILLNNTIKESRRMTLKNRIAISLQTTISELGPVPEMHGSMIRLMIEGDFGAIIALGTCLDMCRDEKSYRPLNDLSRQLERDKNATPT